ncbi:unnamed protein product [Pleuronectes platessa]|uniref:Uncharacterized protein n=1 Tax=Pleuronectes platessa TaxID=8262 RepID=A0A9N7YQ97_PLEPL|nr:unnamed protein product [Pleuronectes platessa]
MLVYCSAALVLLFGVKTVMRNRDWQNEEMLYRSGIYVNPAKAWGNLGNVLKSQGEMEEAEQAYRNALYYRSNMADMLYNLGLLLQESNKFAEALHYYKLAIGSRPTLASAYLNTGIILMNQGSHGRGQAHLPDLRRHPGREPEGPPRPQELGHQLPVQPGQAAARAGTSGGGRLRV